MTGMPNARYGIASLSLCLWGMACVGGAPSVPGLRAPGTTLGAVSISPQNAILSVGGTFPIVLTGQAVTGAPITNVDSVQYVLASVADTQRVRIAANGMVTGLASSGVTPVRIRGFAFKDNVGNGDELIVQVTPTAITGATLSIQPVVPDTAKIARGAAKTIVPVVRNAATGQSVSSVNMRLTVRPVDAARMAGYTPSLQTPGLDGVSVQFNNAISGSSLNRIAAIAGEGTAWVYAEANVYGTLLRDSVQYILLYPATGTIDMRIFGGTGLQAMPTSTTPMHGYYQVGATITFSTSINELPVPISYTFDNPAGATAAVPPAPVGGTSGNVVGLLNGQSSARRFLTPGTYTWTGTVGGNIAPFSGQTATGQITFR